jgi:hypothetical protein
MARAGLTCRDGANGVRLFLDGQASALALVIRLRCASMNSSSVPVITRMGRSLHTQGFFEGHVAEFLQPPPLTDAERATVDKYLNAKYAKLSPYTQRRAGEAVDHSHERAAGANAGAGLQRARVALRSQRQQSEVSGRRQAGGLRV